MLCLQEMFLRIMTCSCQWQLINNGYKQWSVTDKNIYNFTHCALFYSFYEHCTQYCCCFCCCCCYITTTIIIIATTFMQGIYNYITETNHVSRVYSVAAVLYLQSVLQVMLFHPWNMFCTFTLALSVLCVQCPILLFFFFRTSLISCFPGMFLRYCLSDFEMVPFAEFLLKVCIF